MSAVNTAGVLENVTAKQESVGVAVKLDGRNQHVKQVRDITLIIRNINIRNLKVMYFLWWKLCLSTIPEVYWLTFVTWHITVCLRISNLVLNHTLYLCVLIFFWKKVACQNYELKKDNSWCIGAAILYSTIKPPLHEKRREMAYVMYILTQLLCLSVKHAIVWYSQNVKAACLDKTVQNVVESVLEKNHVFTSMESVWMAAIRDMRRSIAPKVI